MISAQILIDDKLHSTHRFNTDDERLVQHNLSLIIDEECLVDLGHVHSRTKKEFGFQDIVRMIWS